MEEIINKWTGELDRCGEQFKIQANDIRKWDAILVENGDKVINPKNPRIINLRLLPVSCLYLFISNAYLISFLFLFTVL